MHLRLESTALHIISEINQEQLKIHREVKIKQSIKKLKKIQTK